MIIECENSVTLTSISEKDTEKILRWRNDELVRRFFNNQAEVTEEEHKKWLETKVYKGLVHQFIISDGFLGKDVGSVYLKDIDQKNRKAEYGIFIGEKDALGRGLGTTVAKAMVKYAFNSLRLHRVYLQVHQDNSRAIKCYEKAGFIKEGELVDDVFVNDSFCNLVIMGIVNPEERS